MKRLSCTPKFVVSWSWHSHWMLNELHSWYQHEIPEVTCSLCLIDRLNSQSAEGSKGENWSLFSIRWQQIKYLTVILMSSLSVCLPVCQSVLSSQFGAEIWWKVTEFSPRSPFAPRLLLSCPTNCEYLADFWLFGLNYDVFCLTGTESEVRQHARFASSKTKKQTPATPQILPYKVL